MPPSEEGAKRFGFGCGYLGGNDKKGVGDKRW